MSRLLGYYGSWFTYDRAFQVSQIEASKLTHVNYGFFGNSNGVITSLDQEADFAKHFATDSWNDPPGGVYGNIRQLYELKKKNRHLKTLLSIGGWNNSAGLSTISSTDAGRKKFVASVVKFMTQNMFDGVDIDWEYHVVSTEVNNNVSPDDGKNFILLLQEFRTQFNQISYKKNWLLTCALTAGFDKYKYLDLKSIGNLCDFINIMTYDMGGIWSAHVELQDNIYPGPNATYSIQKCVEDYLASGISASKINVGYPTYARGFPNVSAGEPGASFSGTLTGTWENNIFDYKKLPLSGHTEGYNTTYGASYSYNPTTKVFLSYTTPTALQKLIAFCKSKGINSLFFWELSGDHPTSNPRSLLGTAYNNLSNLDRSPNNLYYPDTPWTNIKSDPMNVAANNNSGNVTPNPPIDPTPVDPTPVDPIPVDPTPVDPTPTPPVVVPSTSRPQLISYWETWSSTPSLQNLINMKIDTFLISFGRISGSGSSYTVSGIDASDSQIKQFVSLCKAANKKCGISIGGASYGHSGILTSVSMCAAAVKGIVNFVNSYGLQVVDIDFEDMIATDIMTEFFKQLRLQLGSNFIISWTPMAPVSTTMNYQAIGKACLNYISYVSYMGYNAYAGYNYIDDVKALQNWGFKNNQIVPSFMPGKQDINVITNLDDIKKAANYIVQNKLFAMMFWDANRDYLNTTGLGASVVANSVSAIFGSTPLPNPDPTPTPTQVNLNSLQLNCAFNVTKNSVSNVSVTKNPNNTSAKTATFSFVVDVTSKQISNLNLKANY